MEIIFMLTGISLLLAIIFLGAFVWAAKSGQFEDDFTPSVRILFDDNSSVKSEKTGEAVCVDSPTNKSIKQNPKQ
jgi:cbb3-type cytochrome oxidase maturation protein